VVVSDSGLYDVYDGGDSLTTRVPEVDMVCCMVCKEFVIN
jgi:hypothetical protein